MGDDGFTARQKAAETGHRRGRGALEEVGFGRAVAVVHGVEQGESGDGESGAGDGAGSGSGPGTVDRSWAGAGAGAVRWGIEEVRVRVGIGIGTGVAVPDVDLDAATATRQDLEGRAGGPREGVSGIAGGRLTREGGGQTFW